MSRRRSAQPAYLPFGGKEHRLSERATRYYRIFTDVRELPDGSIFLHRADSLDGLRDGFHLFPNEILALAPVLTQLAERIAEVSACAR
jgi:hypothetical protein